MKISVADSCTASHWETLELTWNDLLGRLLHYVRKSDTKDGPAFVGGSFRNGLRQNEHFEQRSLITLDSDSNNDGFVDKVKEVLGDYLYIIYTTYSSSPEQGKYRLVMPLWTPITDGRMYTKVSVYLADLVGREMFDPTSFRATQMMYWPCCPEDADVYFWHNQGKFLEVSTLDIKEPDELPTTESTEKVGVMGAFINAFPGDTVIHEFLSDTYKPGTKPNYYTCLKYGNSKDGLELFSDGKFFSHQASDLVSDGHSYNAFDLVRVHNFDGDMAAMMAWASKLPEVQEELTSEVADDFLDDFMDLEEMAEAELSEFPLDRYPPVIGEFLKIKAEEGSIDPTMLGVSVLSVLGGIFQNRFGIRIDQHNKKVSIWTVSVAPPGGRKSSSIGALTKPIMDFVKRYNEDHQDEILRSIAEKTLLTKKVSQAEKSDSTEGSYVEAFVNCEKFKTKEPITMVTKDCTPEKLAVLMEANNDRMFLADSENKVLSNMIKDAYNSDSDVMNLFLESWGDGSYDVHRMGRELHLEDPALSLCIATQPDRVQKLVDNPEAHGRGMTGRFLFAECKSLRKEYRRVDDEVSKRLEVVQQAYNDALTKCLERTFEQVNDVFSERADYSDNTRLLVPSKEADLIAESYHGLMQDRLFASKGIGKEWFDKAFDNMSRIAAVFHIFNCLTTGQEPEKIPIPAETFQDAIAVFEEITKHTVKVLGLSVDLGIGIMQKIQDALDKEQPPEGFLYTEWLYERVPEAKDLVFSEVAEAFGYTKKGQKRIGDKRPHGYYKVAQMSHP